MVHTSSYGSSNRELSAIQIFWAKNLTGMLWSSSKMSQKRVFAHIFVDFKLISFKSCSKQLKKSRNEQILPSFEELHNIPIKFLAQNI